ncbi:MAG TPA: ribbon-helix-helix protein, CopG family [Terriglobales bacterium]|nr:ribbon-helix-helix protein, CopG family [Terriglobales bacterium]
MPNVRRTHITLPSDLIARIDELVGARGRSAFLAEIAEDEVRRRELLAYLESGEPIWRDEDHPELAKIGSAEWIRRLRGHPPAERAGRPKVRRKAASR